MEFTRKAFLLFLVFLGISVSIFAEGFVPGEILVKRKTLGLFRGSTNGDSLERFVQNQGGNMHKLL